MKKLFVIITISTLLTVGYYLPCFADWLIYHKPEFKGKVIDVETKAPIEDAVVVVEYEKHVYGPTGGYSRIVKVKEVLTDKNGKFSFPPYSTIIQPFSKEDDAHFIIYKPGYGNFPNNRISPPSGISSETIERFFLAETFGKQGEIPVKIKAEGKWNYTKQKVTFGLVELPLLNTNKDRLNAIPSLYGDYTLKELPIFYKLKNEERKRFGLKPVGGLQR